MKKQKSVGMWSVIILMIFAGCGGGTSQSIIPQTGSAEFYLTEQSDVPYDAVWVEVTEVAVHSPGSGWRTVLNFQPPVEIDAIKLVNLRKFVGMMQLPLGFYDRIRLKITELRVDENGISRNIVVPPEGVPIEVHFQVIPDGMLEITIVLDIENLVPPQSYQFSSDGIAVNVHIRGSDGPIIIPPPEPPPEQRPLLFTGSISSINSADQSFLLNVHPYLQPMPMQTPIQYGQIKILTDVNTRYFPSGVSFQSLQIGDYLDVVAVAAPSSTIPTYLALEVFLLRKPIPGDRVEGWALEVLPDLKMAKLSITNPDDWTFPRLAGGSADIPNFTPPEHFIWVIGTESTEILDREGNTATWNDLHPGMYLVVNGQWRSEYLFEARKILIQNQRPVPGDEVFGNIGLIDSEQKRFLLISHDVCIAIYPPPPECFGRLWVKTTPETKIEKSDGNPLTFEDLRVGMRVRTRGAFLPSGDFLGSSVVVFSLISPQPELFEGVILEKFVDNEKQFLKVANSLESRIVRVKHDTVITDTEGNPLTYQDLQVGMSLSILGEWDESDTDIFNAKAIVVNLAPPSQEQVEIVGAITEKNSAGKTLKVAEFHQPLVEWTVIATDETMIQESDGSPVTFEDLKVGDAVWILGLKQGENVVLARLITRLPELPPPPQVSVRGKIVEFRLPAKFVVKEDDGSLWIVAVNERTRISNHQGNPLTFADLQVGQEVTVWGNIRNGHDIDAVLIRVLTEEPIDGFPGTFWGQIERLQGEDHKFFVVPPGDFPQPLFPYNDGVWVKMAEGSIIYDRARNHLNFSDLAVGLFIAVIARQDDVSYPCIDQCVPPEIQAEKVYVVSSSVPPLHLMGIVAGKQSSENHGYWLTVTPTMPHTPQYALIWVPEDVVALDVQNGEELNFDSWAVGNAGIIYGAEGTGPLNKEGIIADMMLRITSQPVVQ